MALISGSFTMTFDGVFGAIQSADVFSATGDQTGYAKISQKNVEIHFYSNTGGIGRLPNVPVAVINVKVQANSGSGIVALTGDSLWGDVPGYQYNVAVASQTFPVGKSPYINAVNFTASSIKLTGGGFQPAATVQIEGASLGNQTGTANEIDLAVTNSLELTGKRITLTNPDGSVVSYFGNVHGPITAPGVDPVLSSIQPIFPSRPFMQGFAAVGTQAAGVLAVQNPSAQPVTAAFTSTDVLQPPTRIAISIPPGSIYLAQAPQLAYSLISVFASAPLRMLELFDNPDTISWGDAGSASSLPLFQASLSGYFPSPLTFAPGTPVPALVPFHVQTYFFSTPFTVAVNPEAATWVKLSPASGVSCDLAQIATLGKCSDASLVAVAVDPSSLAPGTYHANLSVNINYPSATGSTIGIDLNVVPAILSYATQGPNQYLVTSIPSSIPFTVSATTQDGSNWLSANPVTATTPAVITVTENRDSTQPDTSGAIQIAAAGQTISIPVSYTSPFSRFGVPPAVSYGAKTSEGRRFLGLFQPLAVGLAGTLSVSASTDDGANWLEASITPGRQLVFYANAADNHLAPGAYHASVLLQTSAGLQVTMRLSLLVYDPPSTNWIRINQFVPLRFNSASGSLSAPLNLTLDTGGVPLFARVQFPPYMTFSNQSAALSFGVPSVPGTFTFVAGTSYFYGLTVVLLTPGTYTGNIQIDIAEAYIGSGQEGQIQSLQLPFVYTVSPATSTPAPAPGPPFLNTVVNAASATASAIAPGEIATLYGLSIGPDPPANLTLDATGKVSTGLSDTQILFNGTAAPLLFASASQVNAIVPYEVGTVGSAAIELIRGGTRQTLGTVPIAGSAPGLFTLNSSGTGASAALNQNLSINSTSNPAVRGSIVVLYATGEGVTNPPSGTGSITGTSLTKPALPVQVFIGGKESTVVYAGSAPTSVSGLLQVNAVIPADVTPGPAVSVLLRIGEAISPLATTIAVQ